MENRNLPKQQINRPNKRQKNLAIAGGIAPCTPACSRPLRPLVSGISGRANPPARPPCLRPPVPLCSTPAGSAYLGISGELRATRKPK